MHNVNIFLVFFDLTLYFCASTIKILIVMEATITKEEKIRRNILTGNIWKVIIYITMPLFLYQFMNSLFNLIDQIMVAQIGDSSVSAIATISQIKTLISSLGLGIAGGGAIIVSRKYGAGDIKEARKYSNVVFTMSLLVNALFIILIPFSSLILKLCRVPEDLIAISDGYFKLQLIEQILIVFNNVAIALEKSKGNTKIIFVMNIINMIVKLALNSLFIYGFRVNSLIYVEIASIVSQLSMSIIAAVLMFRKSNIFRITFKELSLRWQYVKYVLKISLPLFLGKCIISLGKVSVNALCLEYGSLTVGALGISNNICGCVTNPGTAFEDSESSIVSQNLGNKNMKRTFKIFIRSIVLIFIWATAGFLITRVFFEDQIISLFSTENTSQEFLNAIKSIYQYDCISIPALALNSVVLGILYGYGQTFLATVNNLLRIVTRITVLLILQNPNWFPNMGSEAAGISMGISNGIIGLFSVVFFLIFFIKIKKHGYKGMTLKDEDPLMIERDGILISVDKKTYEMENKIEKINLHNIDSSMHGELIINKSYSKNVPLILIFPGGGYTHCSPRESGPIMDKFLSLGYNTAILNYSVAPYHNPTPLKEAKFAVKYLSNLFTSIYTIGFSAGGHLSGLVSTSKDVNNHIKGSIYCYPVITFGKYTHEGSRDNFLNKRNNTKNIKKYSVENRIDSTTPPSYIWTTITDQAVPWINSLLFKYNMDKNSRYCELHVFRKGIHGSALADETAVTEDQPNYFNKDLQVWVEEADEFIKKIEKTSQIN